MQYSFEYVVVQFVEISEKINLQSLKDLPRIFCSRCHRGHRDLYPHGSGGKATQAAAISVNYCRPRIICDEMGCMNRNIE